MNMGSAEIVNKEDMSVSIEEDVSERNRNFCDELCASQLCQELGVTDYNQEPLKRYYAWYISCYPYRHLNIPFPDEGEKLLQASYPQFFGLDLYPHEVNEHNEI